MNYSGQLAAECCCWGRLSDERLGACRSDGSLVTVSDGHKVVCSYLGLVQGSCFGGERGCVCVVWVPLPASWGQLFVGQWWVESILPFVH